MRVSQEAASRFIVLYTKLLYYAGQKRDILESTMSFDEFIKEPLDMKVGCRDAIYTPAPLLDDFLADQHTNLSDEEQDIVNAWKRYVKGTFVILRHLKKYTIFIGTQSPPHAYGVLGLTSDLEEMFPQQFLPMYIEAVLLPYQEVVICDGLFSTYNIIIGPGMRRGIQEDYREIRNSGRLITRL